MKLEQFVIGKYLQSTIWPVLQRIDETKVYQVIIKERDNRSLNQNALYWMWLGILAAHFTRHGHTKDDGDALDKDDMHDIMRHKFLGYVNESRKIGQTEIEEHKLRSTAKLDKGDMTHYLTQIDQWATEHGCLLPHPADSEYEQLMQAQCQ